MAKRFASPHRLGMQELSAHRGCDRSWLASLEPRRNSTDPLASLDRRGASRKPATDCLLQRASDAVCTTAGSGRRAPLVSPFGARLGYERENGQSPAWTPGVTRWLPWTALSGNILPSRPHSSDGRPSQTHICERERKRAKFAARLRYPGDPRRLDAMPRKPSVLFKP